MKTRIDNFNRDFKLCNTLAEDFNISDVLERFISEKNISRSLAKEYELELKRYLVMCNYGFYSMAGSVDDLWHIFITFTKKYSAFCEQCFGNFIHHTPTPPKNSKKKELRDYDNFLTDYVKYYKQKPPKHIWPEAMYITDAESGNCNPCGNDK